MNDFEIIDKLKAIMSEQATNFFTDPARPFQKAELCLEFSGAPEQVSVAKRMLKNNDISYSSGRDFIMLRLVWESGGNNFRLAKTWM